MSDNNRSDDINDKRDEEARQIEADKAKQDQELTDSELNSVSGGLPAVQKVREAAARMKLATDN